MALPTASDNVFPKVIISEAAAPASPSAGQFKLFVDSSDHLLKYKNSAGTVVTLGAGIADQGTATYFDFTTGAAPASPAAGKVRFYSLTGDHLYQKDSSGTATALDSATGGAAGALVLLGVYVASAQATLDITTRNATGQSGAIFQSDCNVYEIVLENVLPSSGTNFLLLRCSTDGGSTFDATGSAGSTGKYDYGYRFASPGAAGDSVGGAQTSIVIAGSNVATTELGVNGMIQMINPLSTTLHKPMNLSMTYYHDSLSNMLMLTGGARYRSTSAVNAIRFLFNSNNITSGVFYVYGRKNS